MTLVPIWISQPDNRSYLQDTLTEAIRLDHEDMESGKKYLDYPGKQTAESEVEIEG